MLCTLTVMAQQSTRKLVNVEPDKRNAKVINRYNHCQKSSNLYSSERLSKDFTAIFWVDENSLMSTPDVEVSIIKKRIKNAIYNDKEDRVFFIQIKNKTDQPIYIDRSQSFRIDSDGTRYCYYDPHKPLDSLHRERILTIPPRATKNLNDYRWIKTPGGYVEIVEYPEEFLWNMKAVGITLGYVRWGESRLFTEKTTPFRRTFEICYSKAPDFSTYSHARINCYIHEIIGLYYPENYEYNILESRIVLVGDDRYSITSWLPCNESEPSVPVFVR